MTPDQVPAELLAAAQRADVKWAATPPLRSWQAVPDEQVRRLLAAALPCHERMGREQVARAIEAATPEVTVLSSPVYVHQAAGMYKAAQIARDGAS